MNQQENINLGKIFLGFIVGSIFAFLVIPTILAVPMSFTETRYLVFPPQGFSLQWHHQFFTDSKWMEPTIFSLKLAGCTTFVSLVIGTMASLAMVRGILPGKRILNLFFLSPMMIPLIVTAFAVYGIFADLRLIGTLTGMVVAHTVICVPYVILVVTANLYRFDLSLELAARNLGASALKTFMYVTLPLIKPGIIAAGVFCFIESLDELVLVLFLIGTTKMTLPLRMFSEIEFRISPTVAAASTVFIIAAIGTIIALSFIERGKKQ
jgi:ABC-type spermidine/putrescine transport system permease subunit II